MFKQDVRDIEPEKTLFRISLELTENCFYRNEWSTSTTTTSFDFIVFHRSTVALWRKCSETLRKVRSFFNTKSFIGNPEWDWGRSIPFFWEMWPSSETGGSHDTDPIWKFKNRRNSPDPAPRSEILVSGRSRIFRGSKQLSARFSWQMHEHGENWRLQNVTIQFRTSW